MDPINCDLEAEIRQYPEIIAKFADRQFCEDFWTAFANISWYKKFDPKADPEQQVIDYLSVDIEERSWGGSFRYMGGFIADIRNQYHNADEDYMDWYCCNSGAYGYVAEQIADTLATMGWFPVEDDYYKAANK